MIYDFDYQHTDWVRVMVRVDVGEGRMSVTIKSIEIEANCPEPIDLNMSRLEKTIADYYFTKEEVDGCRLYKGQIERELEDAG